MNKKKRNLILAAISVVAVITIFFALLLVAILGNSPELFVILVVAFAYLLLIGVTIACFVIAIIQRCNELESDDVKESKKY